MASITSGERLPFPIIAFPELGPEAVHRLEVENFPTIVINDCQGRDLYEQGVREYRRTAAR